VETEKLEKSEKLEKPEKLEKLEKKNNKRRSSLQKRRKTANHFIQQPYPYSNRTLIREKQGRKSMKILTICGKKCQRTIFQKNT